MNNSERIVLEMPIGKLTRLAASPSGFACGELTRSARLAVPGLRLGDLHAIPSDEGGAVGIGKGEAGRGYFLASDFLCGEGEVEIEEEGERVGGIGHAVGGADGGVESGLSVAQRIGAGFFEGAVELAEGVFEFRHDFAAQAALTRGSARSSLSRSIARSFSHDACSSS